MERPSYGITKRRMVALASAIVLIFAAYSMRLFQIQIVDGDAYADQSRKGTEVSVPASRGEILDRYLRPMAINRTSFSVVFDYAFFPTGKSDEAQKQQNDIIRALTALLSANGEEWNDTLPITKTAPYEFEPDRESSVASLKAKLRMADYATAEQCMAELAIQYKLTAYSTEEQRAIAGVRYEIDTRNFSLKNPFTFSPDISEATYNTILENNTKFPGVDVQPTPVRDYVSKDVAAHLIGNIGPIFAEEYQSLKDQGYKLNDTLGKSGIEAAMESALRGKSGVNTIIKDNKGTVVEKQETTPPVPGDTVVLTLDYNLQKIAQEELGKTIAELRARPNESGNGHDVRSGAVVMVDVKTGGLLVCATWPNYDLSTFNADYDKLLADPDKPLFNRALNGAFACGSTMKPGVALAALQEGVITPTSTPYYCIKEYDYFDDPSFRPTCLVGGHGYANVAYALQESCNIFFYETGRLLGIDKMNQYSALFGLGQKTGVEVGEAEGVLAGPSYRKSIGLQWNPGDTCMAAIGQSDNLFTPVQLAAYAMTIANGGTRYKTHLVQSVIHYDGVETPVEPVVEATVELSQQALDAVQEGMVRVMTDGTGSPYFKDCPYPTAGKTGTAEVSKTRSDHGVFIGYTPVENPEVAIAVVLEDGTSRPSTQLARKLLDAYYASKQSGVAPTPEGELLP